MTNKNQTISIVLGIFVGIAATLSLQNFLGFSIFKWIGASIAVILFSIVLIYLMVESNFRGYKKAEILKLISIVIVTFFPFSLQKAVGGYEQNLPIFGLPIHIFIGGGIPLLVGT